jgi:putative acetyltransferase
MIQIVRCDTENTDFKDLIYQLDLDLNNRYGELQIEYDKYNKIELIDAVVIAYDDTNPVGCGCFKKYSDITAEIKRMFVKKDYRGKGVAKLILDNLENWAKDKNFKKVILETGKKQVEAIKFYTKLSYKPIDNFGQYIGNDNSLCMLKEI